MWNVWAPLIVAIAVAVISALGSYLTARHTTIRAARQELLAVKRVAYAEYFSVLDTMASAREFPRDKEIDLDELSDELQACRAKVALLGSKAVYDQVVSPDTDEDKSTDGHYQWWVRHGRAELLSVLREDLRASERGLN